MNKKITQYKRKHVEWNICKSKRGKILSKFHIFTGGDIFYNQDALKVILKIQFEVI